MFVDEVIVELIAGRGGDGCMAFRREKYIPMGGPFGGSGGKGSDIIFKTDEGLRTLIDLRYKKIVKGTPGSNGQGKNKNGKNAEDIIIKVPIGTTIKDAETGVVIADLIKNNQEVIVAYGGRGGRGNVSLATKSNPCPSYCENGEPGEVRKVKVELRMLADVGLVGLPSVGKSTILSMITNANPKIASYHFTTLTPNLGVVTTKNNYSYTVADLPGLIEGASEGVGLGLQFLRHIERTRLLLHVIDCSGIEGRNPVEDFYVINKELEQYSEKLAKRKQIIVANKVDIAQDDKGLKELEELAKKENMEFFKISAATGEGLKELFNHVSKVLKTLPREDLIEYEERKVYTLEEENQGFEVEIIDGEYIVSGPAVEKLMGRINIGDNESMAYFQRNLENLGINEKLREMGIKEGDTVKILDWEFEWYN